MMESTYSVSSFSGLVSSKRRLVCPPNSSASPKSRQIALACPMWRYPLGSGGKRVCTRPPYLLVFRSSRMMSRMKFDGRGSGAAFVPVSASSLDVFIIFDLIATVCVGADAFVRPSAGSDHPRYRRRGGNAAVAPRLTGSGRGMKRAGSRCSSAGVSRFANDCEQIIGADSLRLQGCGLSGPSPLAEICHQLPELDDDGNGQSQPSAGEAEQD